MKRGEKIIFVVAGVLAVAAVSQVLLRSSHDGTSRQPKDYYVWTAESSKGYVLYKQKGCNSCHRALRMGEAGVAPVLDGEGTRRSESWLHRYFNSPADVVPGTAHDGSLGPDFRRLSDNERGLLVQFMLSLRSNPGSANYPVHPSMLDMMQ